MPVSSSPAEFTAKNMGTDQWAQAESSARDRFGVLTTMHAFSISDDLIP